MTDTNNTNNNSNSQQEPGRARGFIGSIIKPKDWMGYHGLHSSANSLASGVKRLFTPETSHTQDTFETAIERFNLTPEQLEYKKRQFFTLAIILLVLAFAVLGYVVYQFLQGFYIACVPSMVLCFVCLAQAVRYHFWYYQISVQRLGCSLSDWFKFATSQKSS